MLAKTLIDRVNKLLEDQPINTSIVLSEGKDPEVQYPISGVELGISETSGKPILKIKL